MNICNIIYLNCGVRHRIILDTWCYRWPPPHGHIVVWSLIRWFESRSGLIMSLTAMINHVFISFSRVQMYDISYINLQKNPKDWNLINITILIFKRNLQDAKHERPQFVITFRFFCSAYLEGGKKLARIQNIDTLNSNLALRLVGKKIFFHSSTSMWFVCFIPPSLGKHK